MQLVIYKMGEIKAHIPSKALKTIARKVIERYPVFKDIDEDGTVMGDDTYSLYQCLSIFPNTQPPYKLKNSSDPPARALIK